jgi:hypothetical protein
MMAIGKKLPDEGPGEIEAMLPWHAAGTLNARDRRRVDEALARNPGLARQLAAIREEHAEIVLLNESLGAPSARTIRKLFTAIDAEPPRRRQGSFDIVARMAAPISRLSPHALAAAAVTAAAVLLLQAGVIGALLVGHRPGPSQTGPQSGTARQEFDSRTYALVRFAPDARVSEISSFLQAYQASIVDVAKGGLFRLKFSNRTMSNDEIAALLDRLQNEKVISLAVAQ